MTSLQEQMHALTDAELKQLCDILDSIKQKNKLGLSFSGEIYALSSEYSFSDADLFDTDSLAEVSRDEAQKRWPQ